MFNTIKRVALHAMKGNEKIVFIHQNDQFVTFISYSDTHDSFSVACVLQESSTASNKGNLVAVSAEELLQVPCNNSVDLSIVNVNTGQGARFFDGDSEVILGALSEMDYLWYSWRDVLDQLISSARTSAANAGNSSVICVENSDGTTDLWLISRENTQESTIMEISRFLQGKSAVLSDLVSLQNTLPLAYPDYL